MRIPNVNMNKSYSPAPKEVIQVGELTDERDYRFKVDLTDERERNSFIKKCEKIVRNSYEYREFIEFLKSYMDMRECAYFANVNSYESKNIKIEIHHSPFTLYDIVDTVLRKRVAEGEDLSMLAICDEVMALHYMGYIGLIPLAATVHSLVHSGSIAIPVRNVFGSFQTFYNQYQDFMVPELKEAYAEVLKNDDKVSLTPPDILRTKYIEVEMANICKPKKLDLSESIKAIHNMTDEEKVHMIAVKLGFEKA